MDALARIFGPDLIELLDRRIDERVRAALAEREAERRWLTVTETAEYLGVSQKAIRHRIAGGALAYSRQGRRILVDRHALDRDLAAGVR